jgi:Hemerythrin HHE cation binding domain
MSARSRNSPPPACPFVVEAIPFSLIDTPLDYIFADHFRQRSICVALKCFAGNGLVPRSEADMVTAFLDRELPFHHEDEDQDLFPAVLRRALPEDDLGAVLARLSEDHRLSDGMVRAIVTALSATPGADIVKLSRSAREVMQAYAASEHRHLSIENGIVLTIARIRLRASDLKAISNAMKLRRGVYV